MSGRGGIYLLEVENDNILDNEAFVYPNATQLRDAVNAKMTQKIGEVAIQEEATDAEVGELIDEYRVYQEAFPYVTDGWNCTVSEQGGKGPYLYVKPIELLLALVEKVPE